jgi:type IV secretion system protein VirB10
LTDEEKRKRYRSNMLLVNGKTGISGVLNRSGEGARKSQDDPNAEFAESIYSTTEAEVAEARTIGNTDTVIAQGKVIDAALETAINTDLPGMLRAIATRDIYAESGKQILIQKGSRLIGTYNTAIRRGQKRVFVVWTRIIRPDGMDIMVNSPGIDQLGRAGVEGVVDNKYMEIFSNAILSSTVTLGAAAAIQAAFGDEQTTSSRRTFTDGSSETTGSPTSQAVGEFVNNVGSASRTLVDDLIDIRPTITIDQGTILKVFVNRDLIFPDMDRKRIQFVQ